MTNIFNTKNENAKNKLEEEIKKQKEKQKELEKNPTEEPKNPLEKYKNIQTKDTLVKIDRYVFRVSQNIESISTTLNIGIKKIETIAHPIYQKIGGNEEIISFDARILITEISEYEGFKDLVKKAKPLKLAIISEPCKQILIQRLIESKKNWVLTQDRGVSYYCKELSIEGVIL
ncbi:hypothetical protein [Helicobacter cappadocius]|uniref:Uncharacterized protein n=1 Tax=Helicobacter cappadocius TaxID=3063998 RepID=A0AA90PUG7_9HELI|nr:MULTISPECIES: hypothetical protein [unclassified Helicobacter]MDO7253898.1 hypothetical protein [Helicobacter sp. faydin-H75]MDP2539759.1 hypothetical protein [Helicobacter sp. faydin-H76]